LVSSLEKGRLNSAKTTPNNRDEPWPTQACQEQTMSEVFKFPLGQGIGLVDIRQPRLHVSWRIGLVFKNVLKKLEN